MRGFVWWALAAICFGPVQRAIAQDTVRVVGDSVVVRFTEADLRAVLQGLGRYLDRPLLVGTVPSVRITFESPAPMARSGLPDLLRGLAEAHGLVVVADSAF